MSLTEQIETLKQELREFIALSETTTPGKWLQGDNGDMVYRQPGQFGQAAGIIIHGRNSGVTREQDERYATFIARARNISPAMAECLLVAVEGFENVAANHPSGECVALQQILNIWEASK